MMLLRNLCVDFGSTFIKCFVFDGENIVFADRQEFPKPCVNDGVVYEISIENINKSVFEIFETTKQYDIEKCFFAVQMHGYIIKKQDGTFSNYVSWKDKSGDITNPLLKNIDFEKNGTSLKNNLAAVKLITQKEKFEFFTLGSYIAYRLTGLNVTHKTDACASGFFNAETLKPMDTANILLPKVTNEVLPIGKYGNIQIYTSVGDHQLSFLGSGAADNAYLLNIGTATQISTLADKYEKDTDFEKRPYFDSKRLLTVSGLTGGEKLFEGYNIKAFCEEIHSALKKLPFKPRILVGGGGGGIVFDELEKYFKTYNIECIKLKEDISKEGMKKLSNMCNRKIGTMLSEVCFPNFPIILKNENIDFLIIDNEHGAFDYAFLSAIVMNARLIGLPLIVRLPDNNRRDITKLVDMGVSGFLLPMTNTTDDIKKVVDFTKYAPIGKRGISTNRAHTLYNPPPIDEYMESANKIVKVYAQIETKAGVQNIEEILSANGVDGVFVGPNDLSCDMNCIGDNEPIKKVLRTVSVVAEKQNKTWGIITTSKDLINCCLENNVDYISYGSEVNMLKDSCKKIRRNVYD